MTRRHPRRSADPFAGGGEFLLSNDESPAATRDDARDCRFGLRYPRGVLATLLVIFACAPGSPACRSYVDALNTCLDEAGRSAEEITYADACGQPVLELDLETGSEPTDEEWSCAADRLSRSTCETDDGQIDAWNYCRNPP